MFGFAFLLEGTDFCIAPSPGFSVFTPQSARSSVSPSPELNFQTLSLGDSHTSGHSNPLPTVAEEVTDNHDVQARATHGTPSIASDVVEPSSSVMWETDIETGVANRHHVSPSLGRARVDLNIEYLRRKGWGGYTFIWGCVSDG